MSGQNFGLWYEVNHQVRLNPDAPKSTQKQSQPYCVKHISETNLSSGAGTPSPCVAAAGGRVLLQLSSKEVRRSLLFR